MVTIIVHSGVRTDLPDVQISKKYGIQVVVYAVHFTPCLEVRGLVSLLLSKHRHVDYEIP